MKFENTVVVVSHDRHFLNKVCTHIADIDFGKITTYVGNYDFWRESVELAQRLQSAANKKAVDKAQDLKAFIARFSANASKSKQATSRQKQLEKLEIADLPKSTRKYPFVGFEPKRELGREILTVDRVSKSIDGEKLLDQVSFVVREGEKIVFLGKNDLAKTTLLRILNEEIEPDEGSITWGVTTSRIDLPMDNSKFFEGESIDAVNWLRQFSEDKDELFIRGFLGKMLFSGEEALKPVQVFSGGERVRCMLARMMLSGANVLLVDGPTNHLDLESISAVNEGLVRFKGCVLFASHDHQFVQTVANRIIELEDGAVIEDKVTTYDEYIEERLRP
jgi:ATPase subunit of ABC transporter with duplicated ATPase domains